MLDCEIPATPITKQAWKKYIGKLRILSNIHAQLAPKFNALREALDDTSKSEGWRHIDELTPADKGYETLPEITFRIMADKSHDKDIVKDVEEDDTLVLA